MSRRRLIERVRLELGGRRGAWWVLAVALLLALPTLRLGVQLDDRWHAIFLNREPARYAVVAKPALDLFDFFDGDPARTGYMIEQGWAPWWTDPRVRVAFLRPVSAVTHVLDHRLLGGAPWRMHLHSIAWYLAVVAAAMALLRRVLACDAPRSQSSSPSPPSRPANAPWVAGLAAYLFAVDFTHGIPLGWVANRNALVSAAFGLATLALHDRARREGDARARLLAPLAFGLALFAGESGLATLGYLVAYALCLDCAAAGRWRALAPYGLVALAWAAVYVRGRYGTAWSGMYLHPLREPLAFTRAAAAHLPLLAAGELGAPPPDLYPFAPPAVRAAMVAVALAVIALALVASAPIVRARPSARFFLAGSALALLPACATAPGGRLLLLPGFGLIALQAQLVAAWLDGELAPQGPAAAAPRSARSGARRGRVVRAYAAYVAVGHALLAPLVLQLTASQMVILEDKLARLGRSLGDAPALAGQRLVIANGPDFFTMYIVLARTAAGLPEPRAIETLASGLAPVTLERLDARTLRVAPAEALVAGTTSAMLCDPRRSWRAGDRVVLSDMAFTITALTADGRPARAEVRFAEPLESPRYRFVQWQGDALAPLALPPVGGRVTLAAQPLVP